MRKMTLDEFRKIKNEAKSILRQYQNIIQDSKNNINDEVSSNLLYHYLSLQEYLLSFDLSDISFEEWEGYTIYTTDKNRADFSNTQANIDFQYLNYTGNGNFKGCNVRNLDQIDECYLDSNSFDLEIVNDYSNLFLSDIFPEEIKQLYYLNQLTIPILSSLTNEQLKELKEKNLASHIDLGEKNNYLYTNNSLDKLIEFCKYSTREYEACKKILSIDNYIKWPNNSNIDDIIVKIKNTSFYQWKELCFSYLRNNIITKRISIDFKQYGDLFISENEDLFLINSSLPDEVKERYFSRSLTIQDLIDYSYEFQNIPIDYFMDWDLNVGEYITKKYGLGRLQKLVEKYKEVFHNLQITNSTHSIFMDYFFRKMSEKSDNDNDIEKDFINTVKEIIVIPLLAGNDSLENAKMPEWLLPLKFKVLEKISTMEELFNYTERTILLNHSQQELINALNIDNIKRFEMETGFFSSSINNYQNENMFNLLNDFFMEHRFTNTYKHIVDKKRNDYQGFQNSLACILNEMRKDGYFSDEEDSYDFLEGSFRDTYQDIFIDKSAPKKLRKSFYSGKIYFKEVKEHPEYIAYLKDKNLSDIFSETVNINLIESKRRTFGITKTDDFIKVYSSKYGNEKLLQLIAKYGELLSYISIDNYNDELEDEDLIEKNIRIAIIKRIMQRGLDYSKIRKIKEFEEEYPSIFIDFSYLKGISKEEIARLEKLYYQGRLTFADIKKYPELKETLKDKNLYMGFRNNQKSLSISDKGLSGIGMTRRRTIKIGEMSDEKIFPSIFPINNENMLILGIKYGKYLDEVARLLNTPEIKIIPNLDLEKLEKEIDRLLTEKIISGEMMYHYSDMPNDFVNNHKELFTKNSLIQEKFYQKRFQIDDFLQNPELLKEFGDTSIAMGLASEFNWITKLFTVDGKLANYYRLKVAIEYDKIKDDSTLAEEFKNYLLKNKETINRNTIEQIGDILYRLSKTNSTSLYSVRNVLAGQLLQLENPIDSYQKIENIFLKSNLPMYGKMFYCFQILYPDFSKKISHGTEELFDFSDLSRMSPELKDNSLAKVRRFDGNNTDTDKRFQIIYNDLVRIAVKSNSLDLRKYLDGIENGSLLFQQILNQNKKEEELSEEEIRQLSDYESNLEVIYANSKKGIENNLNLDSYSLLQRIKLLEEEIGPTARYSLSDRIVRMFAYSAGYHSYQQLREMMDSSIKEAEKRGEYYTEKLKEEKFQLEDGDFLRCIGNYQALGSSLDSGNVSKEFLSTILGASESDTTPLDIDWTRIINKGDIYHSVEHTPTGFGFGNIYLVIKKDNPNLHITRDSEGNLTGGEYDPSKIEMFGTKVDGRGYETHWGSRTGISMTDVDYILYKRAVEIDSKTPYDLAGNVNYEESLRNVYDDLPALKFEIVRGGYYIPIVDFSGNLLFTKEEYDELKKQKEGLSYYEAFSYHFSNHLDIPRITMGDNSYYDINEISEIVDESMAITNLKKDKIICILKKVFDKYCLNIKFGMDGDLTPGSIEVIDTGSTGRGTNEIGKGDFDFLLRIDSDIYLDKVKFQQFQNDIKEAFSHYLIDQESITDRGDLRYKGVHLSDDIIVDLDISFDRKTDKVTYTTDECLKDRLDTIKMIDDDKYKKVLANIVLAKQILKAAGVYKSKNSNIPQGGLGGVGVENWILQHGGSFIDAARSFVEAAAGKDFDEFKKNYTIWDFGENQTAERKQHYLHDNFITDNMNSIGYNQMVSVLKEFIYQYDLGGFLEADSLEKAEGVFTR